MTPAPTRPFDYDPPQGALDIIHADANLLVVNKPAGLLSVPGKADNHRDSLQTRLTQYDPHTLLVHRLDMATSGLMVFAKTKQAQRHLGLQFEKRFIEKTYQARVWGQVEAESGHINLPLITDWPRRPRQKVCFEQGRSAQTDWCVLDRGPKSTRLALFPKTGRSHQLRVHMLAINHPIIGDRLYAHDEAYEYSNRLNLHAQTLKLHHPTGGAWQEYSVACPF